MKVLSFILCSLILLLTGCIDDPEKLRGDVAGKIGYYEKGYLNFVDSLSGVGVTLMNETDTFKQETDSHGRFTFTEIPAGNYLIEVGKSDFRFYQRNRFVSQVSFSITHLGGGTTYVGDFQCYEVPAYEITLDSYEWVNDSVLMMNVSIPPVIQDTYLFNFYFSETAPVNSDFFDFAWSSRSSFDFFEDAVIIDKNTGKASVKIPAYREFVDHYVVVVSASLWSSALHSPESNTVHVGP